ncbi:mitochondrial fission ELM1 family protein [Phenylobacterium sp.]|uniref:mitochondrial fission ELM1 family protein n=1 Tax=Phenylobacterium sp. TaxID=1871053 RepID=UPI002735280A|nr:mitochondrial fission ELM1 family protein [Phenylobacterium sp.]MDP3660552.1 mitochondrial fission ELM1 family protein [Phenylobacterium sp.]
MAGSDSEPLTIWVVSDGRAGIEVQPLGLADAIARRRPARTILKRIGWKGAIGRLPWGLIPFPRALLRSPAEIAPPWPDLWIAAGRATLPLSTRIRDWSAGATFVVQTQDPQTPPRAFDLVIPPRHDRLEGANVFPITGSPNRVTPGRLSDDLARFASLIAPLPHPRVAVLVGGKSRAFDLSPTRAAAIADQVATAVEAAGGSIMLTYSRRTPAEAQAAITERLRDVPGTIWDGAGENPYFAFLAGADVLLATEDSVNIATEAASTGKPLYILAMEGGSPKFARFHRDLEDQGISRRFNGDLETWSYPPLAETDRAADEILRRLDAHRAGS